jgi:PfaB family protein
MDKIAVIGLGCLFPEAGTPQDFWRNLTEQRDSRTEATDDKLNLPARSYYDPRKGAEDRFYCPYGGYVRDFQFDPSGFAIPEDALLGLDDVFQWSLYVAREALKDAGYLGHAETLSRCGVVLGNLSMPTKSSNHLILPLYHRAVESCLQELLGDPAFRLIPFAPPAQVSSENRRTSGHPAAVLARALSLSRVHLSLDAACASSLYSVKLACDYLLARKADMMLAGAVSAADPLFVHMGFSIFQAYPEPGSPSSPLDKHSAGLIAGEGAGMFVLKRLSDAIRDRDRIYGTILGTGLSNDGRGQSVLSPNPKGQMFAFERAYASARVDPKSIDFVECHATGTALGDRIELNSMDAFFGRHGASPLVGAVKSNVGHLLTAAGMASMTKVLLAMQEGLIPPTIHLKEPQSSSNRVITGEQMPRETVPWPHKQPFRRGAASAFGLGGTNAHVIFETGTTEPEKEDPPRSASRDRHAPDELSGPCPMAIIGMDALFGPCEGLKAFHRSNYEGKQHFVPLPESRWKGIERDADLLGQFGLEGGTPPEGAYIESVDLDFLRFKIPPNEDDRLIPQHLLLLKVADKSLRQTGIQPGQNVAVIVGMETEMTLHEMRARANLTTQLEQSLAEGAPGLSRDQRDELLDMAKNSIHGVGRVNRMTSYIGNIMASRVSSAWDFSGPAFTVSAEENSVFRALEVAQMLLARDEVEAVVVGAVDLAGGIESVLWRNKECPLNKGPATLSFDRNVDGWTVGEGAGAVVLTRHDKARELGDRIYATIDAVRFSDGISAESVEKACRKAFDDAGVSPGEIGYLEASASGLHEQDESELAGLTRAYRADDRVLRCGVGSSKANIGHTHAASGMASLIKAALCLYHRYIPVTPGWSGPKQEALWQQSLFYVPTASKTWFLDEGRQRRIAAVSGLGQDGVSAHMILSEETGLRNLPSDYLVEALPFLIPICGDDQRSLQKGLDEVKADLLEGTNPLSAVAGRGFDRCRRQAEAAYAIGIVGHGKEDAVREIDALRAGMAKAFEDGKAWSSLRGSYFTPDPLNRKGKTAFVYPGGYTSYIGLGQDLFQLFPQMLEQASRYSSRLGDMVADEWLYPRGLRALSQEELGRREKALFDNPIAMFESGILFSIIFTKIMTDVFQVRPKLAVGYSMGEVSMMYALGVWGETDSMSRALRGSPLFRSRLAGPMEAVREAWGLPSETDEPDKIWHGYALRTSEAMARDALQDEPRAYLIAINSPQEVVIAGEDPACRRTIERLGCEHVPIAVGDAIHCEIARADYDELVRVHTLPVHPVSHIDFYSSDRCAPLSIDADTIARDIATVYCHEIDFPRLVRQAYQDGARIFVELGPRENCTHWIGEILGNRPHLAVGTNRKGADDKSSIVRALATLFSHRVDLDLTPLYAEAEPRVSSGKSLVKSTRLGGTHIPSTILAEGNQGRFKPAPPPHVSAHSPRPSEPLQADPVRAGRGTSRRDAPESPDSEWLHPAVKQFFEHLTRATTSHALFLQARGEGLKQIGRTLQLQMNMAASPTPVSAPPSPSVPETPTWEALQRLSRKAPGSPPSVAVKQADRPAPVWDYADLREFAEGEIANVFGDHFSIVDTYGRRVRLPMEPYLLVSRVTALDGETGVFRPCSMTTEYDVPYNAWYSVGGQVPWAVAVEAGQCDLLLISYLGIDFECKGDRVYRLLDCTMTFLEETAKEGDTLRYDIKINSFARTSGTLLFFFEYDCYVRNRRVLEMRGGCAGFFTDEELEAGKGIIRTEQELGERQQIQKSRFEPLLACEKSSFDRQDLVHLAQDDKKACFGPDHDPKDRNPSLHFSAEAMLMLDRVVSVDPEGGPWGLGLVVAEKDLAPDHWYFPCHFKDDNVLAGSLMAEGCGQLLRFYLLYLGLQTLTKDARFEPVLDLPQKVRCRGQVIPKHTLLTYRMEIKEIGTTPQPYAVADVDIIVDGKVVVDFKNLGVMLSESKEPLFTKQHLQAFATGSLAECFGPAFSVYEQRKPPRMPAGDLQLIDRVLDVSENPPDAKSRGHLTAECDIPVDAWYLRDNAHPGLLPFAILMELSLQPCLFLSVHAGTPLLMEPVDLCFRTLEGEGTVLCQPDLRGKAVTSRSELLSTSAAGDTIVQRFRFSLGHEGVPFFEGSAVCGYFPPEKLARPIGLDVGPESSADPAREYLRDATPVGINLASEPARERFCRQRADRPYYRLPCNRLNLLDEVQILEQGGAYGKGYLRGTRRIDATDWYFPIHFHGDPVMPGSLGIESVLQALRLFALHQDLGARFNSPRFTHRPGQPMAWKHGGQIVPEDEQMEVHVHIKEIDRTPERVTVEGDGSVWKKGIRIYEIRNAAICLEEAEADEE